MRSFWLSILAAIFIWPAISFAQAEDQTSIDAGEDLAADPSWVVCNETSFILRVSTAHGESNQKSDSSSNEAGEGLQVKGWQRLRPSECMSESLPADSPRYLFAESDKVHNGGVREWAGQYPICVNPQADFDMDTAVSCALRGLETRRFLRINPAEPVTKLIEPDDFGEKATIAGLQRLMKDAGYKISRVDGISGRRTRDTLKQFLKEAGVEAGIAPLLQMDALADAALSKQGLTGLTVCNQTEKPSWVSIGYREDGSWQSRGWWLIASDDCARPWTKDMTGVEMHLYAQQDGEDDQLQILKNPVETANNFCVAEGKFSALGREFCIDQGYIAADFRPLVTEDRGMKVELTSTDFVAATSGGLRQ